MVVLRSYIILSNTFNLGEIILTCFKILFCVLLIGETSAICPEMTLSIVALKQAILFLISSAVFALIVKKLMKAYSF